MTKNTEPEKKAAVVYFGIISLERFRRVRKKLLGKPTPAT
jgi:hypothetical protein